MTHLFRNRNLPSLLRAVKTRTHIYLTRTHIYLTLTLFYFFQQRLQLFEEEEQQAKEAWSFRKHNHVLTIAKYQNAFRVLPLGQDRFVLCSFSPRVVDFKSRKLLIIIVKKCLEDRWLFGHQCRIS